MALERHKRSLFILEDSTTFIRGDVKRTLNPPSAARAEPVIKQDHPWEKGNVSNYGTVLFDPGMKKFRYWYLAKPGNTGDADMIRMGGREMPSNRSLVCYAESDDGIRWIKPPLNQVDFEGSKENNILAIGDRNPEGVGVLLDEAEADPANRYKALYWEHGSGGVHKREDGLVLWADGETDGMWVSTSPDGIKWTNHPGNPVFKCWSDTSHSLVRDPATKRYVGYGRFGFGRVMARSDSADFFAWSRPELTIEPDDAELAGAYPDTQFYGMSVALYEDTYLGGLWIYRPGSDGAIDTQLAASHDGLRWERVGGRAALLSLDKLGRPLDGMIRNSPNWITVGDKVYIYYGLVSGPHVGPKHPRDSIKREKPFCICLATMRRDGFVSLDAGGETGKVMTKPFWVDGKELHVNVDVAPGGEASIVLCSQTPDPIASIGRSEAITGNHPDYVVRWPEVDWTKQAGEKRRLLFTLRNAKLYSFWFE
jgi:hypothetical protein